MRSKYKVPAHIKKYVKVELYNYQKNKKLLKAMQEKELTSTHAMLVAELKIKQIETVFERLIPEQRHIAEVIFFKHYTQTQAQRLEYISYDSYYWTMSKVIYLVAEEMDLIWQYA